jgi:hypothetical protein
MKATPASTKFKRADIGEVHLNQKGRTGWTRRAGQRQVLQRRRHAEQRAGWTINNSSGRYGAGNAEALAARGIKPDDLLAFTAERLGEINFALAAVNRRTFSVDGLVAPIWSGTHAAS